MVDHLDLKQLYFRGAIAYIVILYIVYIYAGQII